MIKNRKIVISTVFLTTLLFVGIIVSFGKKTSNFATKIPAGTIIKTQMQDAIHTDKPYKDIKTKITANIVDKHGKVIIPNGATMLGDYAIYNNKDNMAILFHWRKIVLPNGSKYRFVLDDKLVPANNTEIVEHVAVNINSDAIVNAKKENTVVLKSFFTLGNIKSEEDVNELMQSKYYIINPLKDDVSISITINEMTDLKIIVEQNVKLESEEIN